VLYLSHSLTFGATLMAITILAATERRTRVFFELLPAIAIFLLDAGVRVWC